MDKKAKKRMEVLRTRTQKLKQQLAGAKQQDDEPGEVERLENEISANEAEPRAPTTAGTTRFSAKSKPSAAWRSTRKALEQS